MEHTSDLVEVGKLINKLTYAREKKDEIIENKIAIDFIRKGNHLEIHEIKKSKKMEMAHEMQALYYLYFLKKMGITNAKAVIDYPLIREKKELVLIPEDEQKIEYSLQLIKEIVSSPFPPEPKRSPRCKKCSYFELCWCD